MNIIEYIKSELSRGTTAEELLNQDVYITVCIPYTIGKVRNIPPVKCRLMWKANEQMYESFISYINGITEPNEHYYLSYRNIEKLRFLKYKKDDTISKTSIPYFGSVLGNPLTDNAKNNVEIFKTLEDAENFYNESKMNCLSKIETAYEKQLAQLNYEYNSSCKELS